LGITGREAASRGVDRVACFREQLSALLESGVDLILFETFMDSEEMEIALRAKKELGNLPEICSFACEPEGQMSTGGSLVEAFAELQKLGAKMMGLNCLNDPRGMVELLRRVPSEYLIAAYPSAGYPKCRDGRFLYPRAPDDFARSAREMVAEGARLVGGCCGTTPAHVAAIAAAIADLEPVRTKSVRAVVAPPG
jgi:homocysteine S-methyltransferase